ncbi:VOC family protein [Phreatobacter oligotrophus]|uniref:VOC family protein n=1 Tax=Phreatobacter oligotrophus TaxID=1122261 RepID=UPI0023524DC3|nr:VOC family protein [Phreatobacter oligotrophus]MBX9990909.1 VOC family protein [Phreatobacter oligotrophus]
MTDRQVPAKAVIPHLNVGGASEAIAFYVEALGAEELSRMPSQDGKRLLHADLLINGSHVFLHDDFPEHSFPGTNFGAPPRIGGSSVTVHLRVESCDAWYERAMKAGATTVMAPHDAFWGDRYGQVVDPFGHSWSFAHPLAKA